ncbi:MAG: menaquinone reductase molybdopterin-binding-like subunit QrcB [Thermodesulfobacteriota bacterium]
MGLDRRGFLQFVIGGAVGTLATPVPWKLIDDSSIWTQNWPWIPRLEYGKEGATKTTVKAGGPEYGIVVNTLNGRPVTAQGDPESPLSRGGIDPLAAGSVQLLYSPARVSGPRQKKDDGSWSALSWEEARAVLAEKLQAADGNVAAVSGDATSTVNEVLAGLLKGLGSEAFYFMPGDGLSTQRAWSDCLQGSGQIGYDLDNADCIVSLGADLMANWGAVVKNQKAFGQGGAALVYCGPTQTHTAAVSQAWVPVESKALGHLALGLAYYCIQEGASFDGPGFKEFRKFIEREYGPAKAEVKSGVGREAMALLAEKLLAARRPLVIPGTIAGEGSGCFEMVAGMALNLLLGNLNTPGGMQAVPEAPQVIEGAPQRAALRRNDLAGSVQEWAKGRGTIPDVLLVSEANPMYGLPQAEETQRALERIPFVVAFSSFMDETAAEADLILPSPLYLERLDDSYTPFGAAEAVYGLCTQLISPQADVQPVGDLLLATAKTLDIDLGVASYEEALKAKAKALGAKWRSLTRGEVWRSAKNRPSQDELSIWHEVLPAVAGKNGESGDKFPLAIAAQGDLRAGTPTSGAAPLALKTIRADELDSNGMYVRLNRETARRYKIADGDSVEISGPYGAIQAQVRLFEGVMPQTVVVPLGLGHSAWDEFNRGKGDNVFKVFTVRREPETGLATWNDSRVAIAKI